jgi:hypothetical protein
MSIGLRPTENAAGKFNRQLGKCPARSAARRTAGDSVETLSGGSMGHLFNEKIKGNFDCRTHRVPILTISESDQK